MASWVPLILTRFLVFSGIVPWLMSLTYYTQLAMNSKKKIYVIGFLVLVIIVSLEIVFIVRYNLPQNSSSTITHNDNHLDRRDPGLLGLPDLPSLPSSLRVNITEKKSTHFPGSQMANVSSKKTNHTFALPSLHSSCSQLDFSVVSPLLEPNFTKTTSNLFLLVLIPSGIAASPFSARRNVIRNTWTNKTSHDWKRVFILGKSGEELDSEVKQEADNFNDILILNTSDNYNNLIIKIISAFQWAITRVNSRFILKADDDVYVRLPYLISWLQEIGMEKFYGGHVKPNGTRVFRDNNKNYVAKDCLEQEFYPSYCSGPFYVLSSKALSLMLLSVPKFPAFPVEDAYIGLLAHDNGISAVKIPGFEFRGNLHGYGNCWWAWSMAIGHDLDDSQFAYVHQKLRETAALKLPTVYHQCLVRDSPVSVFIVVVVSIALVFLYFFFMFGWCWNRGVCLGWPYG